MSELWKNERYFSTFEEADKLRSTLLSGPQGATLQVKIKRCGPEKSMYVVKSRTNPVLKAALQEVEEKILISKQKKDKSSRK